MRGALEGAVKSKIVFHSWVSHMQVAVMLPAGGSVRVHVSECRAGMICRKFRK